LKDPNLIEASVRNILPELNSLSAKLELLTIVGHREKAGHKMISEQASAELENDWRKEVRASTAAKLVREQDLGRILFLTKRESGQSDPPLVIPDSPELTQALLRSGRREILSQSIGSRAVRRSPRLDWGGLVELYGDDATLRERIEALRRSNPTDIGDLLELADKYLNGWRPDDMADF